MEILQEVQQTTHDDYGLKVTCILAALEKFDTLFSLKLPLLFLVLLNTYHEYIPSKCHVCD